EYTRVVRAVMEYHKAHPGKENWENCYRFVFENYGYSKYPGVCHIMPNIAVMILSLLYGEGDFDDTLNICNRCGWDTDCNAGNVAVIMGVRGGLAAIDYNKWRKPINDFLVCSSVVGSLNIMDIPYGASYIAKLACILSGEELPEPLNQIVKERIDCCHFEYPGSTHAIRVRTEHLHTSEYYSSLEYELQNTAESAATGKRSLKVTVNRMQPGENILIYKKTYYRPKDFHDSRYDPAFSPLVYPGQVLHGSAMVPDYGQNVGVSLYVREMHTGVTYQGSVVYPPKGKWITMEYQIPALTGALIDEIGFCVHVGGERDGGRSVPILIDDLYADGKPDYTIEMEREEEEVWTLVHREITQFTKLKGLLYLEEGQLHLSACDFAEIYTGRYDWKDYRAVFNITPLTGEQHMVNVRVQGASRSYAVALLPNQKAALLKNENGYQVLAECSFQWTTGREYQIEAEVKGNWLRAKIDGQEILSCQDLENPYLEGSVGISTQKGSHCCCRRIAIS
ncbi:MAG: ADP-ribosylglycohydrolase family protein, partial [Lachnospiraceae bacterium]|nr:ADP-ribosylglycohydrolase family protein [Lachnospiraceae bacterium]